jgi:AraC-like DNA-binding protein
MSHRPAGARTRCRAIVTRHASDLGRWELARTRPAESLRPFVREYIGWSEQFGSPLRRRALPDETAALIINFGAPYRLSAAGRLDAAFERTSFITGAYDTFQVVESCGETHGVQVDFTLLGLRLFVGHPLDDLTNQALAPEDVFGGFAQELAGRLYDAASWDARFDLLDRALLARLAAAHAVPPAVCHAWNRILRLRGRAGIGALARETGWSDRHFTAQFRHQFGITPKVFARVLRFAALVRDLRQGSGISLADAALRHGYFDQSHLNRDARRFAGTTPGALARGLTPDDGGFGV